MFIRTYHLGVPLYCYTHDNWATTGWTHNKVVFEGPAPDTIGDPSQRDDEGVLTLSRGGVYRNEEGQAVAGLYIDA